MIYDPISTLQSPPFPNVYLPLRLVLLLTGVWRDWIALEVPERAGGAGVWFFFTIHTWDLYHSLCLFSLLFFYLTRWYSPWRWWALSFSSLICLIWPCYIHIYFCHYSYAYYYISIREKYCFVLRWSELLAGVTFDYDPFSIMLFSITIMLGLIYIPRNVPRVYHTTSVILTDRLKMSTFFGNFFRWIHTTCFSIHPKP